jgi:hypothetical protein
MEKVANDGESPETVLLILERERKIIPLSTSAFHVAQRPRKEIQDLYPGAVVIYRNGDIRRIDSIEINGPAGDSTLSKILNTLSGTWHVVVNFSSPIKQSLEETKSLILKFATYDRELVEPFLPSSKPLATITAEIESCASCSELFDVLETPNPEDALDVL